MTSITIHDVPDELSHALKLRAAAHGRSAEAEIRAILHEVALGAGRLKLGALLGSIAQEAGGLSDEEVLDFEQQRQDTTPSPPDFS